MFSRRFPLRVLGCCGVDGAEAGVPGAEAGVPGADAGAFCGVFCGVGG